MKGNIFGMNKEETTMDNKAPKHSTLAEEMRFEIENLKTRVKVLEQNRGGGRLPKSTGNVTGSPEFGNLLQIRKYLGARGYPFTTATIESIDFANWNIKCSINNAETRNRYKAMFDSVFGGDWQLTLIK